MSEINYTLIAYKSDGSTSCRGCRMDEWGSDFELHTNLTSMDLINCWSEIMFQNETMKLGNYEVAVLANGIHISHQGDLSQSYTGHVMEWGYDEDWEQDPVEYPKREAVELIVSEAKKTAEELCQARLVKKRQEEEFQNRNANALISQQERAARQREYEKLKGEFGP